MLMSPFYTFPMSNNILFFYLFMMLMMTNMIYLYNSLMQHLNMNYLMLILMMTIVTLNLIGLIPYSMMLLTYLWNSFMMSLTYWFIFMFSCIMKYYDFTLSHLLPLGSPSFLWGFLVYLETISMMIRPLTLSLRLSCNLMAGHVIIFLISNMSMMSYIFLMFMFMFEIMVSVIQGFVYTLLNDIYMKELS